MCLCVCKVSVWAASARLRQRLRYMQQHLAAPAAVHTHLLQGQAETACSPQMTLRPGQGNNDNDPHLSHRKASHVQHRQRRQLDHAQHLRMPHRHAQPTLAVHAGNAVQGVTHGPNCMGLLGLLPMLREESGPYSQC